MGRMTCDVLGICPKNPAGGNLHLWVVSNSLFQDPRMQALCARCGYWGEFTTRELLIWARAVELARRGAIGT